MTGSEEHGVTLSGVPFLAIESIASTFPLALQRLLVLCLLEVWHL